MMTSTLTRIETILFSPAPRVAMASRAALLLVGATIAALLVAVAGPIYGVAAAVALVGGLLMLRDMRWGLIALFAVIGLLPFATLPFKVGFTPTFLDLALLALFFVWIMRVATRRQRDLIGSPIGALVLGFLLLAVFAFANGLRYGRPTMTTIRNFVELTLAVTLFFLLVNNLRTQAAIDLVARLIMIAGAAAAGIAVIFYVIPQAWTVRVLDGLARFNYPGGYGALRFIEDSPDNPMRAIGTMVDPNVLGGFLALVALLTAPQLVSARPLFRRPWVALFLGLDVLALYLTYSRSSLLGLLVGIVVIGLLRYRRWLLYGAIGVVLLLFLPPAQTYVAHLVEGLMLQDQATLMRLGEYKDALALISRYPWFGVGFGGSPDADLYVGVSSLYLLMAEIMGVIGVAAFLGVMIGFFVNMWRAWRLQPGPRLEAVLMGVGAAVVGVLVSGVLDHYLFNLVYLHMSVIFWTFIGLGMAATLLAQRRVTNSTGRLRSQRTGGSRNTQ
jgi:O-antigen ligase